MQTDLQFIKEDISSVERHRIDLCRAKDRYSLKLRMLGDDSSARKPRASSVDKTNSGPMSSSHNLHGGMSTVNMLFKKKDGGGQRSSGGLQRKDGLSGSDPQYVNQSGLAIVRKKRVHAQVCHFTRFCMDKFWSLHAFFFFFTVFVPGNYLFYVRSSTQASGWRWTMEKYQRVKKTLKCI